MSKDYNKIRNNAAMHASHSKAGAGIAVFGAVLVGFFAGMTKLNVDRDMNEIQRNGSAASTEALATFDNILLPRISSDTPLPVSRTETPVSTPEAYLNGCILQQSDRGTTSPEIINGAITEAGSSVKLDIPALRDCYNKKAINNATRGAEGSLYVSATLGYIGGTLSSLFVLGGLGYAGVNGGLYAYNRRRLAGEHKPSL